MLADLFHRVPIEPIAACRIKFQQVDMITQLFCILSTRATDDPGTGGEKKQQTSSKQLHAALGKDTNLSGLEAFTFRYKLSFPLSLVFSAKVHSLRLFLSLTLPSLFAVHCSLLFLLSSTLEFTSLFTIFLPFLVNLQTSFSAFFCFPLSSTPLKN